MCALWAYTHAVDTLCIHEHKLHEYTCIERIRKNSLRTHWGHIHQYDEHMYTHTHTGDMHANEHTHWGHTHKPHAMRTHEKHECTRTGAICKYTHIVYAFGEGWGWGGGGGRTFHT